MPIGTSQWGTRLRFFNQGLVLKNPPLDPDKTFDSNGDSVIRG